jgi:Rad3-related DNA helicase/REP element-mobilizing transposase RayT
VPQAALHSILAPDGAIARRLGERYEHRPQQLEMAEAVEQAFAEGHHLLVEAGTGVGKSFAYLLPAIDIAVKQKKRIVISTHTISLQEQLIEKDIPLIRSVYPNEFTAVLVKGRSNYLCQRRLEQTRGRQNLLFEFDRQRESLWMIEEWANHTTDGSLADLPALPETDVWDKVCAEHGNCLGKRCPFYEKCFWQAAKRRMHGGNILVVNHALFFSDLALRAAGVSYLPKYDLVILDEAHTVEDVAAQHFGLKISEAAIRYTLRNLYDIKRGKGMLNTFGAGANDAIRDILQLDGLIDGFFERCLAWHRGQGRHTNGRIREANIVANDLTPKLRDLALHLKAMLPEITEEQELSELTSRAEKVTILGQTLEAIVNQSIGGSVYWMDVAGGGSTGGRITLNAAPIDIGEGLRRDLFERVRSVVMTSATLCAGKHRGMGYQPMILENAVKKRHGAYLPHWTRHHSVYAVCFRLIDALPKEVLQKWEEEREILEGREHGSDIPLSSEEQQRLAKLRSERVEAYLDAGHGACWLAQPQIAEIVQDELKHFASTRYVLLAWCIMPNHVHVALQPKDGVDLPSILHSWKSWTANEANKLLGRSGGFWQAEYYDHIVRDENELASQLDYVWLNADAAGLEDWKWRGRDDAAIHALLHGNSAEEQGHEPEKHGLVAHATSDPAFAYIQSRLGVPATARTIQLGSPFDYSKQATLYLETGLPDPNDALRFLPAAGDRIVYYLKQSRGGAFVLFTSYKMMIDAANALKETLDELGLPLLVQGQGAPRKILLERFRSTKDAVLFGTASFWQGIDVQGEQLRNVIIVKLPFAVPDEPVTEARLDAIKRAGGNAFMEYSVPEAIIKLKQGFGRLIRSRTDRGIVVILDSRLATKRYGKLFLEALPECKVVRVDSTDN